MPTGNGQQAPLSQQLAESSSVLANLMASNDLSSFFNAFFKTAIVAGAMLAVLRIGYAGFVYMTTDSFGTKGNAKQMIQDAVIGLLLLLSIWIILYQINPNILNLNILQNVQPAAPATGSNSSMQQFSSAPASNSFFGGAGGQFDSSLQGCGTSGCGSQQDQFAPGLF